MNNISSSFNVNNINVNLTDNNSNNHLSKSNFNEEEINSPHSLLREIIQKENKLKNIPECNQINQSEDVDMLNNLCGDDKIKITQRQTNSSLILENNACLSSLQFQLKPETSIKRHITLKVVPVTASNIINNDSSKLSKILQPFNNNNSTSNGVSKYEAALSLSSLNNSADGNSPKLFNNQNNIIKLVPTSLLQTELNNIEPETSTNLNENSQNHCYMMHTPLDLVTTTITTTSTTSQQQAVTSPVISISRKDNLSKKSSISNSSNLTIPLTTTTTTTVSCLSPVLSSSSSSSSSIGFSLQSSNKIVRDEKRRANHNEVEKRRRNNINKWIVELSKIIPDCSNDQSKHGQSKGGILEKTVQYLIDMKSENQKLDEVLKELDKIKLENNLLKQQNEAYKTENELLKKKLTSLIDEENFRLPANKNSQDGLLEDSIDNNNNSRNNLNLNDFNNSTSKMPPSKIDQILMIAYNKMN